MTAIPFHPCPPIHDQAVDKLFRPARLENWWIDKIDWRRDSRRQLLGHIYNHPHYADGNFISTSELLEFSPTDGLARTRSRVYVLGKPA